jgi:hypothetical protein
MRKWFWSLVVLALLLPTAAFAIGEQYGRITGIVYSPDGAELGGVKLNLTSPNLLGGARTLVSSEDGSFTFNTLPPGKYELKVSNPGLKTYTKTGIIVQVGKTASLYIAMEFSTSTEDKTVVIGEQDVIDTSNMTQGGSFSAELAGDVPTGRSYQDVASFLPGVIDVNGGNPNIHGGTFRNNRYLVDGLDITDPVTLTFSANLNFDSIQEVEVLTGGLDAEYNALGGIINVVTKSGSNNFEMDASYYVNNKTLSPEKQFSNDSLGGELKEQNLSTTINASSEANINFGGPIIKDKLWYYASFSKSSNVSTVDIQAPFFAPHPALDVNAFAARLKLTYQVNQNNTITLSGNTDPAQFANFTQNTQRFVDAEDPNNNAELRRVQGGFFATARLDSVLNENLLFKAQAGFSRNVLANVPEVLFDPAATVLQDIKANTGIDITVNKFRGLVSGQSTTDAFGFQVDPINFLPVQRRSFGPNLRYNGAQDILRDVRDHLQFDSTLLFIKNNWFGSHEFKGGIQVAPTFYNSSDGRTGFARIDEQNGSLVDNTNGVGQVYQPSCNANFDVLTRQTTFPDARIDSGCFRMVTIGANPSENPSTAFSSAVDAGVFIQDEWKPTPFVTIKPGFRFDTFSSSNTGQDFDDDDNDGILQEDITTKILSYSGIGPRLGVAWDPTKDGKTLLAAYVGQVTESGNLVIPDFAGKSTEFNVFGFNAAQGVFDSNPNQTVGGGEGTQLGCDESLLDDPTKAFLFQECRPPVLREFSFIAERQVGDATKIGINGTFRHQYHMFEDDEANLIFDERGVNVIGGINGDATQSVFRLLTPDEAFVDYKGLDFYISGKPSERSQILASYSYSRSYGSKDEDTNSQFTFFLDNPRQNVFFVGPLPSDTPHVVKLTGSYDFDFGLSVGAAYQYSSGAHFDKFFFNEFFDAEVDRRAARGFSPGEDLNSVADDFELVLPDVNRLDLRAQYSLAPLTGQKMIFLLDVFNVFNRSTPLAVSQVDDEFFGTVLARQNPVTIQLGIRYIY